MQVLLVFQLGEFLGFRGNWYIFEAGEFGELICKVRLK